MVLTICYFFVSYHYFSRKIKEFLLLHKVVNLMQYSEISAEITNEPLQRKEV